VRALATQMIEISSIKGLFDTGYKMIGLTLDPLIWNRTESPMKVRTLSHDDPMNFANVVA